MTRGAVTDVGSLDLFLRGRLVTTGVVAGALAAAACGAARTVLTSQPPEEVRGGAEIEGHPVPASPVPASQPGLRARAAWVARLDAEADARTPSPAQREASRRQGRALLRAARAAWPGPWLADLAAAPQPPHHAVVLGATAAAAGCSPGEAALVAAYLTVTGRPARRSGCWRWTRSRSARRSPGWRTRSKRPRRGALRQKPTTCPAPRRPRSTCTPRPTPERRCVFLLPDHDHAHDPSHDHPGAGRGSPGVTAGPGIEPAPPGRCGSVSAGRSAAARPRWWQRYAGPSASGYGSRW